jgi:glycerol-3-phosphate dehydrogenase
MPEAHADPIAARAATLEALGSRTFDVLVIGGGITGCGIAREAALRGLAVALVEKDDFASGTSSRSSRLIHGGVRYLEHGHLRLVFESSAERRRLMQLAPHLVRPLEFTWPVYEGARVPKWKLGAGLWLYDLLAMFRNVGRHRRLSAADVLAREPKLKGEGLRGGARYFDAATDDARLTLANALDAATFGATVANHVHARELVMENGRVAGAVVTDALGARDVIVRARVVVSAIGPWSGDVSRGSKGAHIAVARERVGNAGAVTLLSPRDGRVFFVLPSGRLTIIGTTDTFTTESPDDVRATDEDVRYLLDAANEFFPGAALARDDVLSAWAGIRPLLPTAADLPAAATREHRVTAAPSGLVSITGGKLTTYRVMAADVVAMVTRQLGRDRRLPAGAAPLRGGALSSVAEEIARAASVTSEETLARHLVHSFGTEWPAVWEQISAATDGRERLSDDAPYTVGEIRYAVLSECACTLGDLLMRRTHLAFETRDHGLGVSGRAAAAVGPLLGWSADDQRAEVGRYRAEVQRVFNGSQSM